MPLSSAPGDTRAHAGNSGGKSGVAVLGCTADGEVEDGAWEGLGGELVAGVAMRPVPTKLVDTKHNTYAMHPALQVMFSVDKTQNF